MQNTVAQEQWYFLGEEIWSKGYSIGLGEQPEYLINQSVGV